MFYLLAFVYLIVKYWVFKWLMISYYKKSTFFNEELPKISVGFIRFGMVLHALCTFL